MNHDQARYYLAGIIDGEGHVRLRRNDVRGRRFWSRRVQITNTDPRIIEATCEALSVLGVEYKLRQVAGASERHCDRINVEIYGRENYARLADLPLRSAKRERLAEINASYEGPPVPTLEEITELLALHRTERACAAAVGVTKSTIQYWKRIHGITSQRILPVPAAAELEALIAKHGSERRAAAATGHARKTIRRWRRLNGLTMAGDDTP